MYDILVNVQSHGFTPCMIKKTAVSVSMNVVYLDK